MNKPAYKSLQPTVYKRLAVNPNPKPGSKPRLVRVNGLLAHQTSSRTDPTRTTGLRNRWAAEMGRRFTALRRLVWKAIVEDDCFGIGPAYKSYRPAVHVKFDFPRLEDKIPAFMQWLQQQQDDGILELVTLPRMGQSLGEPWTNMYVKDSYSRGVIRAREQLMQAGYGVPGLGAVEAIPLLGTPALSGVLANPFHVDRLAAAFLRSYDGLKGISSAMDTSISAVLAQGLADGDNPIRIAKKLNYVISGMGQDLGVTDILGRFIPAERRAKMLARTETIRSHAYATLQEAKIWGVAGVTAEVEFVNAGFNVCPICKHLHGKTYTIEEAMNIIPVHPHCFINSKVPVYTSTGWKQIGKVEIGDLVLTHKGRFKKVYGLPMTTKQTPEVVRFIIKGLSNDDLTMTSNHPVLVSNKYLPPHWKEAGKCTTDDEIVLLATRCKRCDKKIPWFRTYCSGRCCSLDITDKQWADPEHRKNMSEKISKKNKEQYANGERDRFATTKAANKKARKMIKDGSWPSLDNFDKFRHLTNTPEHRKNSSDRMKNNNPMSDPAIRKKATESLVKTLELHPEKRLNAIMAKHRKSGKMTWIEQRMAELLDRLGIDYVFQYPILRYDVDFAIPALRIVIECDGEQWHQDKERDLIRQRRIEAEGWFVLRYSGAKINQCLNEIEDEVVRVLANHNGDYEFVSYPIKEIKKMVIKKPLTLYNLSVEEDESYLAKGVVVHNCRCAWIIKPREYGHQ